MATVKKIPVSDFIVEISLSKQEAEFLMRLIGHHTNGGKLSSLWENLQSIGIEGDPKFKIAQYGNALIE